MAEAPPTTPTTVPALICVQCGYTVTGLGAGGRCPECAKSIAHSLRERTLKFPSEKHLRKALTALSVLQSCALLAPFMPLAIFAAELVPFVRPYDTATYVLVGCVWMCWHSAWWLLAAADPTLRPGYRHPMENRAIRTLAALSIVLALMFAGLPATRARFEAVDRFAVVLPPVIGCLQIWIGSRILARFVSARLPSKIEHKPDDLPVLRGFALATAALVAAAASANHLGPRAPALGMAYFGIAQFALVGAIATLIVFFGALIRSSRACRYVLRSPPLEPDPVTEGSAR